MGLHSSWNDKNGTRHGIHHAALLKFVGHLSNIDGDCIDSGINENSGYIGDTRIIDLTFDSAKSDGNDNKIQKADDIHDNTECLLVNPIDSKSDSPPYLPLAQRLLLKKQSSVHK